MTSISTQNKEAIFRRLQPWITLFIGVALLTISFHGLAAYGRRAMEAKAKLRQQQALTRRPPIRPAAVKDPDALPSDEDNDRAGALPERMLAFDEKSIAEELAPDQTSQTADANQPATPSHPSIPAPQIGTSPATAGAGSLAMANNSASSWSAALQVNSAKPATSGQNSQQAISGNSYQGLDTGIKTLSGGAGMAGGIGKNFSNGRSFTPPPSPGANSAAAATLGAGNSAQAAAVLGAAAQTPAGAALLGSVSQAN